MLQELREFVESRRFLGLLLQPAYWKSLDINYEPPRVERLWTEVNGNHLNLHRIHPCEEALFHPHPWPSAVLVVSGQYEMEVGYASDPEKPVVVATMVLAAGSSYEMLNPLGWHSVRPIGGPSLSIMLTGKPWPAIDGVKHPGKNIAHAPMSTEAIHTMLVEFQKLRP